MASHPTQTASLQVEISAHALGLRVHVRGEETFENTMAYWQAITDAMKNATGSGLLLIDDLHGAPLTEQQWLDLVLAMNDTGLRRFRIAHVKKRGLQELEYCELFARDADFDARVFVDEQSAERWLREAGDRR